MEDTRPRITTTKPINLEQLTAEVGVAISADANCATAEPHDVVISEPDTILTSEDLQAAIDGHVPVFPAPVPTLDEKIAELVDAVSVLTDITFTIMEGL